MAHDEAIDAWFSWQARGTGIIKYDPVYHGPLRFYLEGFVLDHFGITPGWTRAIAALAGIGATIVIAISRRLLGRFGAPFAALLFTISPTILTVTRTGREDSLTGLVSLALLLVIANGLNGAAPTTHRRRRGAAGGQLHAEGDDVHLRVGGSLLLRRPRRDGAHQTDRTGALVLPTAAPCRHIAVDVEHDRVHRDLHGRVHVRVPLRGGLHGRAWSTASSTGGANTMSAAVANVGSSTAPSTSATNGCSWRSLRLVRSSPCGAGRWSARGSRRWRSCSSRCTPGPARSSRGSHCTRLIPAVLLAGLGAQAVFDRLQQPRESVALKRRLLAGSTALLALLTAVAAVRPAITDGADPRELLVTVQTSDSVPDLTDRMAAAREPRDARSDPDRRA